MNDTRDLMVFDMATLRFKSHGPTRPVQVTTRSGQVLATVHQRRHESQADVAFRAMDEALRTGLVLTVDPKAGVRCSLRIGLLNPFTGDVAVGGTPETVPLTCPEAVAIDADGTVCTLAGSGDQMTLAVGDATFAPAHRSVGELTRVLAAHQG